MRALAVVRAHARTLFASLTITLCACATAPRGGPAASAEPATTASMPAAALTQESTGEDSIRAGSIQAGSIKSGPMEVGATSASSTSASSTSAGSTNASAKKPGSTNPGLGTFERLNALQREANTLKSALAVYAFYRTRYEQSEGGLRDLIAQVLAASEAELGDYDAAVRQFPYGVSALRGTPAPLPQAAEFHAVDAAQAIATLAASRRIVLVNEAHHVAQTRVLTLALLPRLRALGFTHFAAEGLDERDRDLATRGYPTDASGVYVREPLYGEIVRTALALGFVVVPYESTTTGADTAAREEEQARHLVERVFRAQPQARLFVHAGYAHVHKRAGYLDAEPMAVHLRRMSGFDPLSIDQTVLRPIDARREYRDYRGLVQRFAIRSPSVMLAERDGSAWSLEPDHYDVSVILPPPAHGIVGRPDWLVLGGAREVVPVDLDLREEHLPCVIEARYAAESAKAVPADRMLVERGSGQVVLFLRPGKYRLAAIDASGRSLIDRELRVDASRPAS
jgi:hypothetical protein